MRDALERDATLYLAELYETVECRPDDVFKLIADGLVVAEVDDVSLAEPTRCRVFRDTAVRDFERARQLPPPFALPGALDIAVGTRLTYDQKPYTLIMVGGSKVVLQSDDHQSVEISLDTLELLALQRDVVMAEGSVQGAAPARLSDFTEAELRMALERRTELENLTKPNRTQRRLLKLSRLPKWQELTSSSHWSRGYGIAATARHVSTLSRRTPSSRSSVRST